MEIKALAVPLVSALDDWCDSSHLGGVGGWVDGWRRRVSGWVGCTYLELVAVKGPREGLGHGLQARLVSVVGREK